MKILSSESSKNFKKVSRSFSRQKISVGKTTKRIYVTVPLLSVTFLLLSKLSLILPIT